MRLGQRFYSWVMTSKRALLLLGVLTNQAIEPGIVCIMADQAIPEANAPDGRTVCLSIPRDFRTGQAIALPPKGSRVEAGLLWMPQDSWDFRVLELVYVIPEETTAERINWLFAPRC